MILKVLSSSSAGNCYLLETEAEVLILECGVQAGKIKAALNYNLSRVVGCLVSHEHKDHCKSVSDVLSLGVDVWASAGTISKIACSSHRLKVMLPKKKYCIGAFTVIGFDVKHDCAEPLGFLIHHEESGNILFLTDTYYCSYTFKNLNNILIEANYSEKIIDEKLAGMPFLRNRVIESHMELETCKDILKANDLSEVNNIVLIHLSDSNSDARLFEREISELTCKSVHVARPGLEVNFNKTPF